MKRLGQGPIERDVRWLRVLLGKCGLAQPSGWLPWAVYDPSRVGGSTVTGWPYGASISRSLTIRGIWQTFFVSTTHNSSNYWRFHYVELGTSGSYTFKILSTQYAGGANATLQVSDPAIDRAVSFPTRLALRLYQEPIGSPGALWCYPPAVFVT